MSILWFSGLFVALCALAQDPPKPTPPTDKEIALGWELASELERGSSPLNDAVVVEFVEEIARKLAQAAGAEGFVTVRVMDSPNPLSHSLPGGLLLVRSGLVAGAETKAELAGVLAHHIAHIVSRHKLRSRVPSQHGVTVPIVFLGGVMGACTRVSPVGTMPGAAVPGSWLKTAGRHEEEADLLGLDYLDRAGYDPKGLVDGFDRLSVEGIPETARMTSTVREKAREYSTSGRTYETSSSRFVEIRQRLPKPAPEDEQVKDAPSLLRASER